MNKKGMIFIEKPLAVRKMIRKELLYLFIGSLL
jgi:hypothetical protein